MALYHLTSAMSYLGQAKWVPGQVSFSTLPPGQTSLPSLQPLVEAGLPIAPYIEHGSWVTGEPAIMRYGRDPYRGLGNTRTRGKDHMGLGQTAIAQHLDATYVVLCDNWARFNGIGQGHRLRGLRAAILSAKNAARRAPGDTCRIYPLSAGPLFMTERGLIAVRAKRDGDYDVVVSRGAQGLSGVFEDLQQVEKNWGRNMLARLGKATFQLSNSFYVNAAPEAAIGLKPALSRAKAILAANPQGGGHVDVVYVVQRGQRPLFPSTTIVVRVERQGGALRLTWMPQIAPQAPMGLAGPLTEFVCSDTQAGQMLSSAVNEAIDQGAMAAAIGAIVAGAIGGMLEKPGAGALAGAAVGYVAHFAWTAPYRR